MALTAEGQDKLAEKPVISRVREWEHGGDGLGKNCGRAGKPIYTAPDKLPGPCRIPVCGGEEWFSKGIVHRDQKKNIVHREK